MRSSFLSRVPASVATSCVILLAACGGGGGGGGDTAAAPSDTSTENQPVDQPPLAGLATGEDTTSRDTALMTAMSTGVLALPEAGGSSVQSTVLATSDMEAGFSSTAPGWRVNYWGSPTPGWWVARETRSAYVHAGVASQRFLIANKGGGDVHLTYPYAFQQGKSYRTTLYLRSDVPATVTVQMRRDAPPWDAFGTKTFEAGPAWQKVEIAGTYPATVGGTVRISSATAGVNLWIDDFKLEELRYNDLAPFSTEPIPATLFGMHVNKLGWHQSYPQMGQHVIRLWNTGTTWRDLEPANDTWDWSGPYGRRLDMYVDYIKRNDPNAAILYTMGQTPQWASSTPDVNGLYGTGSSGAPVNMEDWRDYVRTIARRYAGRIRYWELWNEPDYAPHYNGSIEQMIEMARIAREELLAADPANKLVSPGVTSGQGMGWLNSFLAAGGGQYVDIIGFHWYFDTSPEKIGPVIGNVRQLMENYGIGDKPLWNTEGAPGCDTLMYVCSEFVPTIQQIRSTTARALMMMWAKGVSNFNYYFWERTESLVRLVESDYRTPTEASKAYTTMANWMRGARLVDGYALNQQVYVFKLNRGTENRYVLWSTVEGQQVSLPPGWAVTRLTTLLQTTTALPASREITLGLEPVLLEP